jgi:DNA-directed RNA polymerase specialized sigma subunit
LRSFAARCWRRCARRTGCRAPRATSCASWSACGCGWRRASDAHPTDEEAADALGVSVHDYRQLLIDYARTNTVSLEACLINGDDEENNNLLETIADAEDPYEELLEREQTQALTSAIENLAERERQVIHLYYYEGLTFKEIGQVMNISESRVYQIHYPRAGAPARAAVRLGRRP